MHKKGERYNLIFLKIIAFGLMIAGFGMVYSARWFVEKYKLNEKVKCDYEDEMGEEELKQYKFNKALVNLKLRGMLVALPGLIIFLFIFR